MVQSGVLETKGWAGGWRSGGRCVHVCVTDVLGQGSPATEPGSRKMKLEAIERQVPAGEAQESDMKETLDTATGRGQQGLS